MELETLFADQKWNILKAISKRGYSPLQLANKLNTSIANISQQLRLLEAANLVKTEKIPSRDKGKPRKLFSLTHDTAYLIPTMQDFAHKKLLKLSDHQKIILKIWFLKDKNLHKSIEKLYWELDSQINLINIIAVKESEETELVIVTVKPKDIEKKISSISKELKSKKIKLAIIKEEEAKRQINNKKGIFSEIDNMLVIYDPDRLISKNLDGGES